jgi:2-polyprenyl-3-methyl-5-hydroxy-6-metoxy-1,4-benzoquinol methylase
MMTEPAIDHTKAEAFVERLFEAAGHTMETFAVYLGDRLGLYAALAESEDMTSRDLAAATGTAPRYAREWCEYQVATGVLDVDDASADADLRRFSLPREHAVALIDPDSEYSVAPMSRFVSSLGPALPKLLDAFRSGGGVSWEAFGTDTIEAQGDFNRPWLRSELAQAYLPSVPEIHERLLAGGRVADIACGVAWAGVSIAKHYPDTTVVGLDPDESSIERSRNLARAEGVSDRVSLAVHDCATPLPHGPFDFALMVESLHDVARPVEILSRVRESLNHGGAMIVADEKVGESLADPGPADAIFYGFSVLCCLPAGLAETPSAGTGTVMRADTLRAYATEAGFKNVEILERIDHPLLRFYLLRP